MPSFILKEVIYLLDSSKIIYTLEEYHYEHTVITLKSLVNTIYNLEGLKHFATSDFDLVDRIGYTRCEKDLQTIYEDVIVGFKYRNDLTLHFWCNHKIVHLGLKMIDECAINPINSKVYIEYFKEVIK